MALNFRQTEILELARAEGRVVVQDLAQRFDVTEEEMAGVEERMTFKLPAALQAA